MAARYVPRDFLVRPEQFGTDLRADWRSATSPEEATFIAAAYLQHRAAKTVWEHFDADDEVVADLANRIGTTEATLWRKLAGYAPASLTDVFSWVFAYDASVLPESLATLDDILPPVPRSRAHKWRYPPAAPRRPRPRRRR